MTYRDEEYTLLEVAICAGFALMVGFAVGYGIADGKQKARAHEKAAIAERIKIGDYVDHVSMHSFVDSLVEDAEEKFGDNVKITRQDIKELFYQLHQIHLRVQELEKGKGEKGE